LTKVLRLLAAAVVGLFASSAANALDVQALSLAKGQEVWLVTDHTLPMIAMAVALPAGSAYDPKDKPRLRPTCSTRAPASSMPLHFRRRCPTAPSA